MDCATRETDLKITPVSEHEYEETFKFTIMPLCNAVC